MYRASRATRSARCRCRRGTPDSTRHRLRTAVRLFVERARQHKPCFAFEAAQAPMVAELVSRLEGIPLALELAAARIKVAVGRRNQRAAEGPVQAPDRRRARAAGATADAARAGRLVLRPAERSASRRCSHDSRVFVGGFDLEAAEHVCAADPVSAEDVLDLLASLVEKSLVHVRRDQDDSTRYRMLETIRDYAREKLEQTGDRPTRAVRTLRALLCAGRSRRTTACGGQNRPSGFGGSKQTSTMSELPSRWRLRARRIRSLP